MKHLNLIAMLVFFSLAFWAKNHTFRLWMAAGLIVCSIISAYTDSHKPKGRP